MKKELCLLAASAIFVCANAAESGAFVGFEADYSFNTQLDDKAGRDDEKFKGKNLGLGVKGGYDFGVARIYGALSQDSKAKDKGINWRTTKLYTGADWTPEFSSGVRGVLGGFLGYAYIKDTNPKYSNSGGGGFMYGAKVGLLFDIDTHNSFEMGYKCNIAKFGVDDGEEVNFDLTQKQHSVYAGYNYKF
ncbi:outer membrane beta-barrel protein [Campylobacter gastrosuis]|uniref:Outer membrane beta-barrel protein n=1 Tax=Campylobacter gastrosuis TaxID=2974576 RepID=A0ABT7HMR0_9BACT|nr:outer membrane beta-barrel protein [Campylobacter gastrosuis]MDL0088206.1 outer membrane beta-barrel protein [Campylobacter gastrosuis]